MEKPESTQTDAAGEPVISIALLIKNGMPQLKDLLANLRGQQGCPPFEIVAVDSGSTDGSLEALHEAGARVTQIPPETFRFGPTRQMAFGLTRGRVIVTMSQDALPANADWLDAMTRPILEGNTDIVGATEQPPQNELLKLVILNCTSPHSNWTEPYVHISCVGLAISREGWQQTGFGDVHMSEDKHLGMIARDKSLRMQSCTTVPLLHGHEYTFMSHIKRSFNEGMGARDTDGYYSFGRMLADVFRFGRYRMAVSAVIRHHALTFIEASWFPLRPVFVYFGWRFGKKYWR